MKAPVPRQSSAQAPEEIVFRERTASNYHGELEGYTSIGYATNSGCLTSFPVSLGLTFQALPHDKTNKFSIRVSSSFV